MTHARLRLGGLGLGELKLRVLHFLCARIAHVLVATESLRSIPHVWIPLNISSSQSYLPLAPKLLEK